LFGCLGFLALILIMPQIGAIFRGECIQPVPRSASDAAFDAEAAADDAAEAAAAAASKAGQSAN